MIKEGSQPKKCNNTWIASWSQATQDIIYGRIIKKLHSQGACLMLLAEHWVIDPVKTISIALHILKLNV
jgi:hypothetical protein